MVKTKVKHGPRPRLPRCVGCGQEAPPYYLTRGLCETCRLATWLPADYIRLEEYAYDSLWKHSNATKCPPTGVAFLDDRPPRICESAPKAQQLRPVCRGAMR